jgi:hypothetical protein
MSENPKVGRGAESRGILVLKHKAATRRLDLLGPRIELGRARGNDVRLNSGTVSERHARLDHRDGFWVLTDVGSRNGTYLNGRKIDRPVPIREDDTIAIGDFILRIEAPPPPQRATIPMPGRPNVQRASRVLLDGARRQPIVPKEALDIVGPTAAPPDAVRWRDTEPPEEELVLGPVLAPHRDLVRQFLRDAVVSLLGPDGEEEPKWKRLKEPLARCLHQIGKSRGYDETAIDHWSLHSDEYAALRVELTELVKRRVGFYDPDRASGTPR